LQADKNDKRQKPVSRMVRFFMLKNKYLF